MTTRDDIWIDRGYETRHIPNLPRDVRLHSEDVTVAVDYARKAEMTSSLTEYLKASAERADNVGIDEFEDERQRHFVEFSEVFVIRSPVKKSEIVAFIVIGPTLYAHHFDSCIAEIQVIRSRDTTDVTYGDLAELAIEFAKQLDIGYTHTLMAVSANCQSLVRLLQVRLDFHPRVVLPRCVNVAAGVELADNVLLIREIQPTAAENVRQMRSSTEVLSMLSRHGVVDGPEDDPAAFGEAFMTLVEVLPQTYTLKHSGLRIKLRNIGPGDDRLLYQLTSASANRGEGYSIYEFPSLASFRQFRLLSGSCVFVVEDDCNGRIVGYFMHSPAGFQRSPAARYAECDVVLDEEYQGRGIGKDLTPLFSATAKYLGYIAIVNYYFSNNVRARRILEADGYQTIGNISSAGYLIGAGWTDAVIVVKSVVDKDVPSLVEVFQRLVATKN